MSRIREEKELNDALPIVNYFFVIKKNTIYQENFETDFCRDKITATTFKDKKQANVFRRLLLAEGLNQGEDFIEGYCDNSNDLVYYPNDWLSFFKVDNQYYVIGI